MEIIKKHVLSHVGPYLISMVSLARREDSGSGYNIFWSPIVHGFMIKLRFDILEKHLNIHTYSRPLGAKIQKKTHAEKSFFQKSY